MRLSLEPGAPGRGFGPSSGRMRAPFSIIIRDRHPTGSAEENMRFSMHDIWREMNPAVRRIFPSVVGTRKNPRSHSFTARTATVAVHRVDVVHIEKLNYETGR